MQLPSPYESMILRSDEKVYFNLQFSSRQTLRIHSSQKMNNPLQRYKISMTPYKGPPPRSGSNANSVRPGILTYQRQTRKAEQKSIFEGLVTRVSFNPTKKTETSMNRNNTSILQNQSSLATRMTSMNDEKTHMFRIPIRATKPESEPTKFGSVTDRPTNTSIIKETEKLKIHRRRISNPLNEGINDGRYSNIKFIKNERSKSQCDIQYSLTTSDSLIPATDNRHQIIEAVMREYSLDFIPENSKYIICQNVQSHNYSVVFTEKSVPTCKECNIPISITLSPTNGFSIVCKSGYCSKQTLYCSSLSPYVTQELWTHNLASTPDMLPIEKQGVSKMIQNGIYKHRDMTRTLSNFNSCLQQRPTTSMSPSRKRSSHNQRKENNSSSHSTIDPNRLGRTQKIDLGWRRHRESIGETKEYFNLRSSFSRTRSPAKIDSYSISRNESMRDQRNDEKEVESKMILKT